MEGKGLLSAIVKDCGMRRVLALDEPFVLKGISFYPVNVGRIFEFYACVEVLLVEQRHLRDKKLLKLPFLWFLCYAHEHYERLERPEYGAFVPLLYGILELATRCEGIEIRAVWNEDGDLKQCDLFIGDTQFNHTEFLHIRQIILAQAGIERDERLLNEDTARMIRETKEHENKKSGYVPPTLEDLADILAFYLHKDPAEIKDFSLRRFNRLVKHIQRFEEYKLLKGGECTGMVTFKKPIPHWLGGFEAEDALRGFEDYRESNLMKI